MHLYWRVWMVNKSYQLKRAWNCVVALVRTVNNKNIEGIGSAFGVSAVAWWTKSILLLKKQSWLRFWSWLSFPFASFYYYLLFAFSALLVGLRLGGSSLVRWLTFKRCMRAREASDTDFSRGGAFCGGKTVPARTLFFFILKWNALGWAKKIAVLTQTNFIIWSNRFSVFKSWLYHECLDRFWNLNRERRKNIS